MSDSRFAYCSWHGLSKSVVSIITRCWTPVSYWLIQSVHALPEVLQLPCPLSLPQARPANSSDHSSVCSTSYQNWLVYVSLLRRFPCELPGYLWSCTTWPYYELCYNLRVWRCHRIDSGPWSSSHWTVWASSQFSVALQYREGRLSSLELVATSCRSFMWQSHDL